MKSLIVFASIFIFLASAVGGFFIFKKEKIITIENIAVFPVEEAGVNPAPAPEVATTTVDNGEFILKSEELILQAQALISETQKFIEEEKIKLSLIKEAKEKSEKIKGIYAGRASNFKYFNQLLDETELNGAVVDIKESYGTFLPASMGNLISKLHENNNWVIARIVIFRDSSLIEEKPDWYLTFTSTTEAAATTTVSLWRDKAGQHWLDPENFEVQDYIIEFSKKAIDSGFDELQFDYIRYPDDYENISGTEKIKVIGNFFSKLSDSLRMYKPSIILSVDLFGYVATQFNSYGTGQRLLDAGKYFDYLSFMLYPSHFYGGFNAKGVYYSYPEAVEHPYDIVYYSIISAKEYLSLFGIEAKIRPWLQDFDLKADRDRGVFYDAEKVILQIEAAQNASSSDWLLWNPSFVYTKEALAFSNQNSSSTQQ